PLEPYDLTSQFSRALFDELADAFVLSLQPDLMTTLVRSRREGYLFYPYNREAWPDADQRWLAEEFARTPYLEVEQSMQNIRLIVARIRECSPAPILIYNLSSVVPGESIRWYADLPEVLSTRIRKFNLELIKLAQETD